MNQYVNSTIIISGKCCLCNDRELGYQLIEPATHGWELALPNVPYFPGRPEFRTGFLPYFNFVQSILRNRSRYGWQVRTALPALKSHFLEFRNECPRLSDRSIISVSANKSPRGYIHIGYVLIWQIINNSIKITLLVYKKSTNIELLWK